jgi:outer membrane protein
MDIHMALSRISLAAGLFAVALPASALDLKQAYELALQNDQTLRAAEATFRADKETKWQAWAAYLPQVTATFSKDDDTSEGTQSFFSIDPGTGLPVNNTSSFDSAPESESRSITLRQTIFNWERFQGIFAGNASAAAAHARYESAKQALMVRTAEAYFSQLAAQDQLETARANREAIGRQLEQSKKRFEVGLIAITDVQESQAAFDQATADDIAAERNLASAREGLRVILGVYGDDLEAPSDEMPLLTPEPASAEAWVELAVAQNLDLLASRENADAARATARGAWNNHLPTLDLVASRSKFEETDPQIIGGVAAPSTTDVDSTSVALQLNVPIFAGGASDSRRRQANHRARAAEYNYELALRNTERTARDALLGVTSEISRVKALRQGLQSSETALKATEAGFEVGTRTTVDVLNARGNMFRAKTNYLRAKYDYVLNTLRLKQAAGMLSETDVLKASEHMD